MGTLGAWFPGRSGSPGRFCFFWDFGYCGWVLETGKRPRSPPWHRRQRKARAKARLLCHRGDPPPQAVRLLRHHHGSMAPKGRETAQKGRGKQNQSEEATKDAINFGYPQPVVSALQAIATRSTAGLFRDPVAVAADQSVQQLAQTQANMLDKLGKRINGNLRAKRSLQEAATAWLGKIGQHLAALTSRLGTVAARLDQDQMEAMTALQQASVHLEASAQEQVDKALGGMGPTWNSVQEAEVLRLAACLRAFSAVGSGEGSSAGPFQGDASSLGAASSLAPGPAMPSFQPREIDGHAFSTPARSSTSGAAMEITNPDLSAKRRWNQRGSRHPRPSKSPRRELDLSAEPWARVATGLTPDRPQRTRAFPDEEELIPAVVTPPYTWDSAWYHISRQCWVQGAEYVGCYIRPTGAAFAAPSPHGGSSTGSDRRRAALGCLTAISATSGVRGGHWISGGTAYLVAGCRSGAPSCPPTCQARAAYPGSCSLRPHLQHRRVWAVYCSRMAVSGGASCPGLASGGLTVYDMGLDGPAGPCNLAVSDAQSPRRARPLKAEQSGNPKSDRVRPRQGACWHLHDSLLAPFVTLGCIVVYRIIAHHSSLYRSFSG